MKKLINSDKTATFLLLIISVLLGFLVFIGKGQLNSTKVLTKKFTKFQIETIKSNSKLDKTIQLYQQHDNNLYQLELHPTTLRSEKNEKDIIKVKADVINLKSIIK